MGSPHTPYLIWIQPKVHGSQGNSSVLAGFRWGMRVNPWLKWGWTHGSNEGEPMAQIYWKYYPSVTDEFPWVPWTFGWIQMRYGGEPMAQINWSYYLSEADEFLWVLRTFGWIQRNSSRWGMGVNPWLKLIANMTLAILMSFLEFHGLLVRSRWGMGVNPWLKLKILIWGWTHGSI